MAKLYHAPVTRHGRYGPLGTESLVQAGNAGAARVPAALYRVTPPRKRKFCYNPDGEAKGASPRGGLVGCNKRWYGAEDGWRFLARRGDRARALGWTSRELFGLLTVPEHAKPSFNRLSRYDETGLIWLLNGRRVVALTQDTAAIQTSDGIGHDVQARQNKPVVGPLGDSLDAGEPR